MIDKPVSTTKYATYKSELNPKLNVHEIYSGHVYIPDSIRQAFTRIRLMSHSLKIDGGRWSRAPREMRLSQCNEGHIQTQSCVVKMHNYNDDALKVKLHGNELLGHSCRTKNNPSLYRKNNLRAWSPRHLSNITWVRACVRACMCPHTYAQVYLCVSTSAYGGIQDRAWEYEGINSPNSLVRQPVTTAMNPLNWYTYKKSPGEIYTPKGKYIESVV